MTLVLPNPNSPQNGQPLDATVVYQNQTAIAQAIQSFDATQIQAGTLSNHTAFSAALDPQTRTNDTNVQGFVPASSQLTWSIVSGLNGTMTAGIAYVQGIRVAVSGVNSHTFTASQDTYIDVDYNGNVYYQAVANGAASPSITANSIRIAKIITNGTAISTVIQYGYDSLGNQIYVRNPMAYSAYVQNTSAISLSSMTNICSVTLPNAPAGDYLMQSHWACNPSGGGNGSMNFNLSGTNGNLAFSNNLGGGIHTADSDYNTAKWSHRYPYNRLLGHQGGTFTVTLQFAVESTSTFNFNNSNDTRWGTSLHIVRI